MTSRILFFYQTFTDNDLIPILKNKPDVTDIHLASIHFGHTTDNKLYIHLNDDDPDASKFNNVWMSLKLANKLGINVSLLIGGAGGGWSTFFSNYDACYELLKNMLTSHDIITGINLDIEESVTITNICKLISDIKRDFHHFEISMSPVQYSLQTNNPGMGGFSYRDLMNTSYGQYISYMCGQFYQDYSLFAFDQVINNGYHPEFIVMGSIAGLGSASVIKQIKSKYPNFGGVFSWEYDITRPDPLTWSRDMGEILHQ